MLVATFGEGSEQREAGRFKSKWSKIVFEFINSLSLFPFLFSFVFCLIYFFLIFGFVFRFGFYFDYPPLLDCPTLLIHVAFQASTLA